MKYNYKPDHQNKNWSLTLLHSLPLVLFEASHCPLHIADLSMPIVSGFRDSSLLWSLFILFVCCTCQPAQVVFTAGGQLMGCTNRSSSCGRWVRGALQFLPFQFPLRPAGCLSSRTHFSSLLSSLAVLWLYNVCAWGTDALKAKRPRKYISGWPPGLNCSVVKSYQLQAIYKHENLSEAWAMVTLERTRYKVTVRRIDLAGLPVPGGGR